MKNILIVEDAKPVSQMLSELLSSHGFNIVGEIYEGKKILSNYKKHKPDLVIMDIVLPDLDGLSAAKQIMDIDSNAKIIAISATDKPHLREKALKIGIKYFLKKPFTNKDFINHVISALNN